MHLRMNDRIPAFLSFGPLLKKLSRALLDELGVDRRESL